MSSKANGNNENKDLINHRSHFVDQQLIFLIQFRKSEIEEWHIELLLEGQRITSMRARRRGVEISLHSKRFHASSSRKMGREQKKWNEGGGGKERREQRFLFYPPPALLFFFAPALTLAL